MSDERGERWVVVDSRFSKKQSRETCHDDAYRYLGPTNWAPTIALSGTFSCREAAEQGRRRSLSDAPSWLRDDWAAALVVRRVVQRRRRDTDAECAVATQRALDRAEKAEQELAWLRSEYTRLRAELRRLAQ